MPRIFLTGEAGNPLDIATIDGEHGEAIRGSAGNLVHAASTYMGSYLTMDGEDGLQRAITTMKELGVPQDLVINIMNAAIALSNGATDSPEILFTTHFIEPGRIGGKREYKDFRYIAHR